jgi:hypothetical protein
MPGQGIAPYGFRYAEKLSDPIEVKRKGYFGKLPAKGGRTSTEISASDEKGNSYPLLVPGLTKAEIKRLLDDKKPTDAMYDKAERHAAKRKAEGKSPFAEDSELRYPLPEMKKGGKVSSVSKRADGIAQRGKTRGKMV